MGKFPGKPSKISGRKRITVSQCVTELVNESVRAAQVIYYGLSMFNEMFGSEEQVEDFLGFSRHQVKEAVETARNFHRRRFSLYEENAFSNALNKFESELKVVGYGVKCSDGQGKSDSNSIVVDSEKCFDGGGDNTSVIRIRRMKGLRKYKNAMARKLLRRAKKTSSNNMSIADNCLQEKGIQVPSRKFVLPSHSAHSSRVIKPNKKFMDNDSVVSEPTCLFYPLDIKKPKWDSSNDMNVSGTQSVNCLQNAVQEEVLGSNECETVHCAQETKNIESERSTENSVDSQSLIIEGKRKCKPSYKLGLHMGWYGGTDNIAFSDTSPESTDKTKWNTGKDPTLVSSLNPNNIEIGGVDKKCNIFPRSSGKVILRQARLNFNTHPSSSTDGAFSNGYATGGNLLPVTIECGVCGAVRFYRFVKQARKFGIFTCESCRKFISKLIKRQSSLKGSTLPLKCQKGKGMCFVPAIVRNQQWKSGHSSTLLRCSYQARCPACWLKMCLKSFKMPDKTHNMLSTLLPIGMQSSPERVSATQLSESLKETTFPVRNDSDNDNKRLRRRLKKSFKMHVKNVTAAQSANASLSAASSHNTSICVSKMLRRAARNLNQNGDVPDDIKKKVVSHKRKRRRYLMRRHKTESVNGKLPLDKPPSEQRQRIELKGPRVKHVCRSASIVLGQHPATFPKVKTSGPLKVKRDVERRLPNVSQEQELSASEDSEKKTNEPQKNYEPLRTETELVDTSKMPTVSSLSDVRDDIAPALVPTVCKKQDKLFTSLPSARLPSAATRKERVRGLSHPISIDFWESYDPDEVCNSGFALIGSEPFQVRAICFLCGSAGQEQLIHCASCCEPYHKFCLEDGLRDPNIKAFGGTSFSNWVCQRCTVCSVCGNGQGQQLSCQRCHRTYHTECLSDRRLHSPDRPWVCSTCLRCKSCGNESVTNFVGNIPLCKVCFKLRQKGNFCPLCQGCYEDHDYDTKMMECVKCKSWVHSRCEGLSDEKYHILSYLPDSVEFICRKCCEKQPPSWWNAVEEELKAGYLTVLKLLSKNRKAYSMLRCSPKKHCECHPQSININTSSDLTTVKHACRDNELCANYEENMYISITDLNVDNVEYSIEVKTTYQPNNENNELSADTKDRVGHCGSQLISNYNFDSDASDGKNVSYTEDQTDAPYLSNNSFRLWREKYNLKECSVRVKDCISKDIQNALIPVKVDVHCTELTDNSLFDSKRSPSKVHQVSLATPTSDSGISSTDEELKSCLRNEGEDRKEQDISCLDFVPGKNLLALDQCSSSRRLESFLGGRFNKSCVANAPKDHFDDCLESLRQKSTLTFLSVKNKVNSNEYSSVLHFHQEMEDLLKKCNCSDLLQLYYHYMQEVFPWFNPKFARVSNKPICGRKSQFDKRRRKNVPDKSGSDDHNCSMEVSILDDSFHVVPDYMLGKSLDDFYSGFCVQDSRVCVLCKAIGDGLPSQEGRLLYCGQNEWAHTNCALWSAEVFEEIDGSLQNVHGAMSRGRQIRCDHCGKRGASVGCCTRNCPETYHFPCARKVKCTFMDDKNVFCPSHAKDAIGKVLLHESDFEIRRPVYVELDRKKKKFAEPKKVKLMIGSLSVENMGEFVSDISDTSDAIIPNGFSCTKLFWSSVEPWRIVQYHIKTVLHTESCIESQDCGKNITVDHSQERRIVEEKLNEISKWNHYIKMYEAKHQPDSPQMPVSICNKKNSRLKRRVGYHKYQNKQKYQSLDDKIVSQVVNYILDMVSSKDVEDNSLHDSQTAADLLPPELKEAIFEDLPHDLIDGISMQDILPKLMVYEDIGAVDKCDGLSVSEQSSVEKADTKVRNNQATEITKKIVLSDLHTQDKDLLNKDTVPKHNLIHCNERSISVLTKAKSMKPKVNMSNDITAVSPNKSELLPRSLKRSSSLTWNCKFDTSALPAYKRHKSSHVPNGGGIGETALVNVNSETPHTLQKLHLPEDVPFTDIRSVSSSFPSAPAEFLTEEKCGIIELAQPDSDSVDNRNKTTITNKGETENKLLPWSSQPKTRFLQLDGAVDSLSSSSSSEGGNSPHPMDSKSSDSVYEANDSSSKSCGQYQNHSSAFSIRTSTIITGKHKKTLVMLYDTEEEPVRCNQCRCTYRTKKSFERHLPTCSSDFILSTSESDPETSSSSEEESLNKQEQGDNETATNVDQNLLGGTTLEPRGSDIVEESAYEVPEQNVCDVAEETGPKAVQESGYNAEEASVPEESGMMGVEDNACNATKESECDVAVGNDSESARENGPGHSCDAAEESVSDAAVGNDSEFVRENGPDHGCDATEEGVSDAAAGNDSDCVRGNGPDHGCDATEEGVSDVAVVNGSDCVRENGADHGCNAVEESGSDAAEERGPDAPEENDSPQYVQPDQNCPPTERFKGKPELQSNTFESTTTSTTIFDLCTKYLPRETNSYLQIQSNEHFSAPSLIMQQIPSQGVVPTFIEAFQEQTGQNLHLVATLDTHTTGYSKQFIATNTVGPGSYPVQPPGGFARLPLVSNMPSTTTHPAFFGSVIPPTQPNSVHCISSGQMMIGSTPSLEMYNSQQGGVYLGGQPMYISNFETVVSNTVMSSSQLVSAVPGVMAASSSFSATTTQVFQASKLGSVIEVTSLEPVVGVQPSYVIFNQQTPSSNSPVRNMDLINCTTSAVNVPVTSYSNSIMPVQQKPTEDTSVQISETASFSDPNLSITAKRNDNRKRTVRKSPEMPKIITSRVLNSSVNASPKPASRFAPIASKKVVRNNKQTVHKISEISKNMSPRYINSGVNTSLKATSFCMPVATRAMEKSDCHKQTEHKIPEISKITTPRLISSDVDTSREKPRLCKLLAPRTVIEREEKIIKPRFVNRSPPSARENCERIRSVNLAKYKSLYKETVSGKLTTSTDRTEESMPRICISPNTSQHVNSVKSFGLSNNKSIPHSSERSNRITDAHTDDKKVGILCKARLSETEAKSLENSGVLCIVSGQHEHTAEHRVCCSDERFAGKSLNHHSLRNNVMSNEVVRNNGLPICSKSCGRVVPKLTGHKLAGKSETFTLEKYKKILNRVNSYTQDKCSDNVSTKVLNETLNQSTSLSSCIKEQPDNTWKKVGSDQFNSVTNTKKDLKESTVRCVRQESSHVIDENCTQKPLISEGLFSVINDSPPGLLHETKEPSEGCEQDSILNSSLDGGDDTENNSAADCEADSSCSSTFTELHSQNNSHNLKPNDEASLKSCRRVSNIQTNYGCIANSSCPHNLKLLYPHSNGHSLLLDLASLKTCSEKRNSLPVSPCAKYNCEDTDNIDDRNNTPHASNKKTACNNSNTTDNRRVNRIQDHHNFKNKVRIGGSARFNENDEGREYCGDDYNEDDEDDDGYINDDECGVAGSVDVDDEEDDDDEEEKEEDHEEEEDDESNVDEYGGGGDDEDDSNGGESRCGSPTFFNGDTPEEKSPYIMYEICSQDGFCCSSKTFSQAWQKVFDAVQLARISNKMPPLPQNPFTVSGKGLQMLGLKHNAFKYLVEQLPGVGRCVKYKPCYHKQRVQRPEDDLDTLPPPNKTGCIRSEPYKSRGPYDMFSWLASSHRNPPKFIQQNDNDLTTNRRATSSNLPMAMRFRHLKGTNPNKAVGVYQSHIHGRGLFCLRDIESGEMVIEYAGEVIRSTLTDKREKFYESKGIGCYMFRIDDQLVVDATMRGNAARFINHSCDPNCYSRVVDILGKKHILIFALRRIPQGEELTYDYKFPFEDEKIPCTCGSRKCRKYLN